MDDQIPELFAPIEAACENFEANRKKMVESIAPGNFQSAVFVTKVQQKARCAEDLEDFDTFFPAGTKSELCKCLTKEMWEEYKDMSCEEKVTFKTCIYSGIANLDSGIGVYAGSHNAYSTFNKLFDKVIQNYHGHKPTDKHVSDMKSEGI